MKNKRFFEWIAGDNIGAVEVLESISEMDDEIFYNFASGEVMNERFISKVTENPSDLKEKFMVEVNSMTNIWTVKEKQIKKFKDYNSGEESEIPTLHDMIEANQAGGDGHTVDKSDADKLDFIPPGKRQDFYELPKIENYCEVVEEPVATVKENVVVEKHSTVKPDKEKNAYVAAEDEDECEDKKKEGILFDPVGILVGSCKKNPVDIDLTLTINLPGKAVYQIADSNFEDGGGKFIDFIVNDIDTKILIDALRNALKTAYSE